MTNRDRIQSPGRRISQKRGQKTYDSLIATGFDLLAVKEFESITIAELAQTAGYSVGAFYARFRSKDEFFDAMIAHHIDNRTRVRERIFARASNESLINDLLKEAVTYYWKQRRFWRAAIVRSFRDPGFWKPISEQSHQLSNSLITWMTEQAQRSLTKTEETNVRFAIQITLGTINNSIINRPGPVFLGQARFIENLVRAFLLISDYETLLKTNKARRRSRR